MTLLSIFTPAAAFTLFRKASYFDLQRAKAAVADPMLNTAFFSYASLFIDIRSEAVHLGYLPIGPASH